MRRFRIGLAGLGAAARQVHLPAYAQLPNLDVVGGVDAAVRDGAFPFPLFGSTQEMIDKTRPDILAVLTPPESHHALSRIGLQAGCHGFCEKPLTPTLEEADELCALSRQLGRVLVANNQYRFMNIHQAARRRIGRPEFGELLFLSALQTFYTTASTEAGWRGHDPERTCKEFGIHVLDLCRFFFDQEPLAVTARMPKPGDPRGPELLNLIRLDFPGDRVAHITLDRLCRGRHRYLSLRLDGSAGCIETRLGGGAEVSAGLRGGTRRAYLDLDFSLGGRARLYRGERYRKIAADPLNVFAAATRRLLRTFLVALESGETPPCEAHDNRHSIALMRAAYESSRRGETVTL